MSSGMILGEEYGFMATTISFLQVEKERAEEIARDNHTLLTKMQRIMSTQGSVEHRNTYRHHRCTCNCSPPSRFMSLAVFIRRSGRGSSIEKSAVNVR